MLPNISEHTRSLALQNTNGDLIDIYFSPLSTGKDIFVLYDHNNNTSQSTFSWLDNEKWIGWERETPGSYLNIFSVISGTLAVVVSQPYGFDFATFNSISSTLQQNDYSKVMKQVKFPDGGPDLVVRWHSMIKPIFAFNREKWPTGENYQFFTFDYQRLILKNYCLGQARQNVFSSPDGNFLAWNVIDDNHPWEVKEVDVLSLETGQISTIKNVQLIGWGEMP